MIKSFKHKGFQKVYEIGSSAGIQSSHKNKLGMILVALEVSHEIEDMYVYWVVKNKDTPNLKNHRFRWFLDLEEFFN